jgi:hypothetical protein
MLTSHPEAKVAFRKVHGLWKLCKQYVDNQEQFTVVLRWWNVAGLEFVYWELS